MNKEFINLYSLAAEYDIFSGGRFSRTLPPDFNYAGIISHAGAVIAKEDSLNWRKSPCPMLLIHGSKDQAVSFYSSKIEGNLYTGLNYLHASYPKQICRFVSKTKDVHSHCFKYMRILALLFTWLDMTCHCPLQKFQQELSL